MQTMRFCPVALAIGLGVCLFAEPAAAAPAKKPDADHQLLFGMRGLPPKPWPDPLFPFIDEFGQYIHKDWPGKVHSASDFAARKEEEANDLAAHPAPRDWDQYGGWKDGSALKATGFFRVEKYEGKWWLVDPEGRLFFSNGIDCVRWGNETPLDGRENWFAFLPDEKSPFAAFYSKWAKPINKDYYKGKTPRGYNFTAANLLRKYGEDWKDASADLAHRRLRSWGVNTVGNWSSEAIYLLRRTPYVVAVNYATPNIAGSQGMWKQFPDVFDPDFEKGLRQRMAAEKGKSAEDPWCIGYFIDNELGWGKETSLAAAALASPPKQAAKVAFVEDLKAKYKTIEALNAAWGTPCESWDALLAAAEGPDEKKAHEDLLAFNTRIAERYFQLCRDAVRESAPNHLYLGCRFAGLNEPAARAAAHYCDVVSKNLYKRPEEAAKFELFPGAECPLIIGEFHFGALDRGMFHTGLVPMKSQEERAAAYKAYVEAMLRHPLMVGCHWFEYGDEPTTGRFDGENYQIGFLDNCDTPYPETIAAARAVGAELYEIRGKAD
ncbi:MAG: beta-galactosidase [Candidatus Sumerlaeota bacterium]|nr:beta-galactosidase [Candidatus Sumerlaeota bacterium]